MRFWNNYVVSSRNFTQSAKFHPTAAGAEKRPRKPEKSPIRGGVPPLIYRGSTFLEKVQNELRVVPPQLRVVPETPRVTSNLCCKKSVSVHIST